METTDSQAARLNRARFAQEVLLANEGFIPYLLQGLLLNPPERCIATTSIATKEYVQEMHAGKGNASSQKAVCHWLGLTTFTIGLCYS